MIEKGQPARLFRGEEHEEWETPDLNDAFKIIEALSEPLRQWTYRELEKEPLRQAELAKRASLFFNKKVTSVLMRYHLQRMKKAGLVRFEHDARSKRAKVVHLASELRIQVRPFLSLGMRRSEELDDELSRIFRSRAGR